MHVYYDINSVHECSVFGSSDETDSTKKKKNACDETDVFSFYRLLRRNGKRTEKNVSPASAKSGPHFFVSTAAVKKGDKGRKLIASSAWCCYVMVHFLSLIHI